MKIRHVILTRFNLQYKESTHHLSTEWLEGRIQLFQTYTLPSIQAQTNQDFEWLILIDARTPDSIYQRLQDIADNYKVIQLVRVAAQGDEALNAYYRSLANELGKGYDILMSTRLDSDDCLMSDFIGTTYHLLGASTVPVAISFPNGLQYFSQKKWTFRITYPYNHFLTLCEKGDVAHSALGYDHTRIQDDVPLRLEYTPQPMWTEIVHGGNIANNYAPALKPYPQPFTLKNIIGFIALHLHYRGWQLQYAIRHPKKVIGRIFSLRTSAKYTEQG